MSRIKLNINLDQRERKSRKPSDVARRFSKIFKYFLNPELQQEDIPIDQIYVPLDHFEEIVDQDLDDPGDSAHFFKGVRGIGKSTFARKKWKLSKQMAQIQEGCLIIPALQDSDHLFEDTLYQNTYRKVGAACELLLRQSGVPRPTNDDIYEFTQSHKPELLVDPEIDLLADPETKVKQLRSKSPRAYYLMLLKILLNKSSIDRVDIILDEIEEILPWELMQRFLQEMYVVFKCLRNNNDKNYRVRLVVIGRPDTYRSLSKENFFNAKHFERPWILDSVPELDRIFSRVFDHIKKESGVKIANLEDWKNAYEILKNLTKQLDARYGNDIISALCNHNVRDSYLLLGEVISNRRWIQKDKDVVAVHRLNRWEYDLEPTTVLRAIGYGNGDKYVDFEPCRLPNIFKNNKFKNSDLVSLAILRHFLTGTHDRVSEEGSLSLNVDSFIENARRLFRENEVDFLHWGPECIEHLKQRGVLDSDPSHSDESNLFVTPRGIKCYQLLSKNGDYISMLRDDIFSDQWSEYFSAELDDEKLMYEIAEFVSDLIEREYTIVSRLKNDDLLSEHIRLFGDTPLVNSLFNGLKGSLIALKSDKTRHYSKLSQAHARLRNLYSL